eukprot:363585-Chlamydomonas_euryale.AAC.9
MTPKPVEHKRNLVDPRSPTGMRHLASRIHSRHPESTVKQEHWHRDKHRQDVGFGIIPRGRRRPVVQLCRPVVQLCSLVVKLCSLVVQLCRPVVQLCRPVVQLCRPVVQLCTPLCPSHSLLASPLLSIVQAGSQLPSLNPKPYTLNPCASAQQRARRTTGRRTQHHTRARHTTQSTAHNTERSAPQAAQRIHAARRTTKKRGAQHTEQRTTQSAAHHTCSAAHHTCSVAHPHMQRGASTHAAWRIHTCSAAHPHMQRGTSTHAAWRIHTCSVAHPHMQRGTSTHAARRTTHAAWRIHTCSVAHPHMQRGASTHSLSQNTCMEAATVCAHRQLRTASF